MKQFFATSLMAALFACLSITANAQTPTVTIVNTTNCPLEVAVFGSSSTSSCGIHATASAVVQGGSSVTIPYIDDITGLPTQAFNIGSAARSTAAGTWVQANTPLSNTCYTTNSGTSPCGTYDIVLNGSTVTIN